jgi:aspartyl-tRNA(Asn)/glutamyl-tRNA(Gln) amidotransferase subunit B
MSEIYDTYEVIIGLEVHTQLLTKSKNFSPDPTEFGALPNHHVSVISLGHPGTLPKANKKVVEFAVRLGLACGCELTKEMNYARKNYFYADLPKGYQITQDLTPICRKGHITIKDDNGNEKIVDLTRIHIEEDAGKSIHDIDPYNSLVDLNRAGVALLEIVTEPVMRTSKEAYNFLQEVRKLVRYLDICDGNMEEGSLRCDANISVMKKGAKEFGTKIEVKNMNSIRNVQRAIEFEIKRQVDALEKGEKLYMETRTFDAVNGITIGMRSKESAHDYRYFPEPDLQPLKITNEYIEEIRKTLPPLPNELLKKYILDYSLPEYDATILTEQKATALYFEEITKYTKNYKSASNWMMGEIKSYLNEAALDIDDFILKPEQIAEIISLIDTGKVSHTAAAGTIFPEMIKNPNASPISIAEAKNLVQESNTDLLADFVQQAIAKYPDKVAEYKNGKVGLAGLFMGEVMKLSKGKADPKVANKLLTEALEKA